MRCLSIEQRHRARQLKQPRYKRTRNGTRETEQIGSYLTKPGIGGTRLEPHIYKLNGSLAL
jgi:hypothetical protein